MDEWMNFPGSWGNSERCSAFWLMDFSQTIKFIQDRVDVCVLPSTLWTNSSRSDKGLYPLLVAWNRCLLLQKPQLHLYRSQIIEAKPKGRQPLLAPALLFAAIVLFVRKSSYTLSDTSITAASGWRWKREVSLRGSWRILLVFCLQRLEETSRGAPLIFLFWLLLNFCTER